MSSETETQVTALIASTLRVDRPLVRRDSTFGRDLGADSLDCVTLILAVEDEFGIDIHDEDAVEILTVEQMIEYVTVALAAKEPMITSRSDRERQVGRP
jgi:acyl carrier protein